MEMIAVAFFSSLLFVGVYLRNRNQATETDSGNNFGHLKPKNKLPQHQLLRHYRRRIAWAERRLLLYPDKCHTKTKEGALKRLENIMVNLQAMDNHSGTRRMLTRQVVEIIERTASGHAANSAKLTQKARNICEQEEPKARIYMFARRGQESEPMTDMVRVAA